MKHHPMNPRDPWSRTWLTGYWIGVVIGTVGMAWHPPRWVTALLILTGAIAWGMYAQDWWDWRKEIRQANEEEDR